MTAITMAADKISWTFMSFYKKLVAHYNAKKVQDRTVTELTRLSDRELNDIGLSRSMIGQQAWEAYRIELEQQTRKHGGVV